MGRHPKDYDSGFFITDDDPTHTKKMWYMIGVSYECYTPWGESGIRYSFRIKGLDSIVKRCFEMEHSITRDKRKPNSTWIQLYKAGPFRQYLGDRGLDKPKEKRGFPKDIPEGCESHFVRGFLDAKYPIRKYAEGRSRLKIQYNDRFLKGLSDMIGDFCNVLPYKREEGMIAYRPSGFSGIADFIYSEMDLLEEHELYVPWKKRLFERNYSREPIDERCKVECQERIKKAKTLLKEGMPTKKAAITVGYSHLPSFYRAFRDTTGMRVKQYKELQRDPR